jgi:prevent-host-death family protein
MRGATTSRVDSKSHSDYHVVMNAIGVAELKAHLSEHLQAVRRGETVVVLDRREPIARIVPLGAAGVELVVRPAKERLQDVPLLGPIPGGGDVLDQLWEERAERF